ncbi:MAG: DUF6502 family protein [Gammaproteobacteria bacterium]|nr:DUF6502 family protein [Gammaproteobacteria bacterium]
MKNISPILSKAIINLLKPIVRIMLRYDITHGEFVALAKRAYIETAATHYQIEGRKQTYSRIAVITGLNRKEVVRLSQLDDDVPPVGKQALNRAARVISGWTRDPDFLNEQQQAKDLVLRGSDDSFEALAGRYSGDITGRAILDELLRVGAVTKIDKQTVRLNNEAYIPQDNDVSKIEVGARCISDLSKTVAHNLEAPVSEAYFQRQVSYRDMPSHIVKEFHAFSKQRCVDLVRECDQWLAQRKQFMQVDDDEQTHRVGLGIYFFENKTDEE